MQRSDGPAIRDTIIWFAAFAVTGGLGYLTWGTWWAVPCFIAYGVLYGSSTDSRWHECGHGTAFKTRWMNDALYQIASFMVLREPTPWRWSHTRHHTDTIIVGRDPEIAVPRPPDIAGILMSLLILKSGPKEIKRVFMHCFGRLHPERGVHSRVRVPESLPDGAHLGGDLGGCRRRRASRPARSCRPCMSASCRPSTAAGSISSSG